MGKLNSDYSERINLINNDIKLHKDKLTKITSPPKVLKTQSTIERLEKEKTLLIEKNQLFLQNYPKNILKHIIYRNKHKRVITYEYLYNIIPPDLVSADLIDEISRLLRENDIRVIEENEAQQPVRYLDKIDEEIIRYERDVENQLSELFKGTHEKSDRKEKWYEQKETAIINASGKMISKLSDVSEKIPLPHLPQLAAVTPRLAKDTDSLLISSTRVKQKKYSSLSKIKNIESTILDEKETDIRDKDISEYQGPKIFSKARFDNDRRLSLFAKTVGDRAEEIVIKFLNETLLPNEKATIRWLSKAGETPGWDIGYFNSDNQLVSFKRWGKK